jgi:DNA-binding response OmpR family regulator
VDEKKILIVDNDDTIRDVLEKTFSKAGYCVRLAANAEEVLEALRKEYIPILFVDLGSGKMNGFELCRIIRNNFLSASIYALSRYAELFNPHDKSA